MRGRDLTAELMGNLSFTEHFWLLVTGALPSAAQRRVLDATLVAIAEHGLVPERAGEPHDAGRGARGTAGSGGGRDTRLRLGRARLVRGGRPLLCGDRCSARTVARRRRTPSSAVVREYRSDQRAIPGYGHPLHKDHDPRARRLFEIAAEAGSAGRHIEIAQRVEALLPQLIGKPLALNVSGAIPAVLLDAGYPLLALKGVPILARTASLIAHLLEEQQRPIGFVLSHAAAAAIDYDGGVPPGFGRPASSVRSCSRWPEYSAASASSSRAPSSPGRAPA